MAYRKRYARRRPMMRRRRFRKPVTRKRNYRGTGIVAMRRSVQQSIQGSAAAGSPYKFLGTPDVSEFRLRNTENWSELVNVFKEYRIMGVKIRFHLRRLPGAAGGLPSGQYTSGIYPQLYFSTATSGTEYNDVHYQSIPNALEDPSTKVRVLSPEKPITVWLPRPCVATPAYSDPTASAPQYTDTKSPWISTGDANVLHYRGRFLVDSFADTNQYLDVITTYYLQFRGIK